jgi:hypothetical protein
MYLRPSLSSFSSFYCTDRNMISFFFFSLNRIQKIGKREYGEEGKLLSLKDVKSAFLKKKIVMGVL